ncbi:MAG TPA: hypothetical protein ENJ37_07940 [Deltaproteobacteria bacterium]|nr:hypothetical protein [Deltaproteobacteria bacterium]
MISRNLKALLILLALVAAVHSPVVFGGRTLMAPLYQPHGAVDGWPYGYEGRIPVNTYGVDLATPAYYEWPVNKLVGDLLASGELPLWNPYQAAGTPLAADYSTRAFFPYQIIEDLSPWWLWDYFLLGRLVVAGFFTFLALELAGLGFTAAILGAAFYIFSGTFTWFVNLEQMANPAMTLPLLLYALERTARRGSAADTALAGAAVALTLLGGQPETALYVCLLGLCYYVFRCLGLCGGARELSAAALKGAVVFTAGLLLAAPLVIPFIEFVSLSHHLHHPGAGVGTQHIANLKTLFVALNPGATAIPADPKLLPGALARYGDTDFYFRIFATKGIWDYMGGYTGVVSVFLSLGGLAALALRRIGTGPGREEGAGDATASLLLFFLAFGAALLLKNFGVRPFVYLGELPFFDRAWSPRWSAPAWVFPLSAAAACGYALLERRSAPGAEARAPLVVFAALAAAYVLFALPGAAMLVSTAERHFSPHAVPYAAPAMVLSHGAALLFALCALVATTVHARRGSGIEAVVVVALVELWWMAPRGYDHRWLYFKALLLVPGLGAAAALLLGRRRLAALLGCLAAAAFFLADAAAPRGMPSRYDPFSPPPYVELLKAAGPDYRAAGFHGALFPNHASALGVHDIHYINALLLPAYRDFRFERLQRPVEHEDRVSSALWFTGRPERSLRLHDEARREYFRVAAFDVEGEIVERLPYYSFLAVRHLVFPAGRELAAAAKGRELRLVYDGEVRVYENLTALPRAYVAYDFKLDGGAKDGGPREATVRYPRRGELPERRGDIEPASVTESGANSLTVEARAARAGLLVLSDTYYRGWRVEVDGEPAELVRVNGVVRGVEIGPGSHRVRFVYDPASFRLGAALMAAAAAAMAASILVERRRSLPGETF